MALSKDKQSQWHPPAGHAQGFIRYDNVELTRRVVYAVGIDFGGFHQSDAAARPSSYREGSEAALTVGNFALHFGASRFTTVTAPMTYGAVLFTALAQPTIELDLSRAD